MHSAPQEHHAEARIVDGDSTLALMVGIFGMPRTSAVGMVVFG